MIKVMGIIPARAGSRQVPGKNIRQLLNKPVVSYTLEAALAAERLDRVVVTTDDGFVKQIGEEFGVAVIDRPADLATDQARMDEVMRHCCEQMEAIHGYRPDVVVLLYANIPVRAEGVIDRVVEKLAVTGADSVQTMSPVGKFHPYWLYQLDEDKAKVYIPNTVDHRQDLPGLFAIDGAVGAVTYESLIRAEGSEDPHAFWGEDRRGLVQEAHETVDIDSLRDFYLAEAVLRCKNIATEETEITERVEKVFPQISQIAQIK